VEHPLYERKHTVYAINVFGQTRNPAPGIIEFVRRKKRTGLGVCPITDDAKSVVFKKFWNITLVTDGQL